MSRFCFRSGIAGAAIAAALICGIAFGQGRISPGLRHAGSIHLQGSDGYVDYLVIAPAGHILYAGYASANSLVVIDTDNNKVVATVGDLKDVRSIALVPELNLGFTSNRGENTVGVIDLKTHRLLRRTPNGRGPDAIIYNRAAHLVYVANHEGRSATLIDPSAGKTEAVVPLGGLAEYAQADPATGLVYQNVEDKNEIAVVDTIRREVVARYKTAPGKGPTGLALDAANHRLFCACGNDRLVVIDEDNGKIIAVLPIGAGADFVAYDPGLRRIYTANGDSGTMTVIRQDTADHYVVMENVPTHKGAHALAVNPATHGIYAVHGNTIEVYESRME